MTTIKQLRNSETTSRIRFLRRSTRARTTSAQIQRSDSCNGGRVKSKLHESHVFFASFISLLLLGIIVWNFQEMAAAQSSIPDDVKHNTPGQTINRGQPFHLDVELALVNATVTDPHDRLVTG